MQIICIEKNTKLKYLLFIKRIPIEELYMLCCKNEQQFIFSIFCTATQQQIFKSIYFLTCYLIHHKFR